MAYSSSNSNRGSSISSNEMDNFCSLFDKCSCIEQDELTSRCFECSESLCDSCALRPQNLTPTQNHQIGHLSNDTSAALTTDSEILTNSSISPSSAMMPLCDFHSEPQTFFCRTCSMNVCGICAQIYHNSHELAHPLDADGARHIHFNILNDVRKKMGKIDEALDYAASSKNTLQDQTQQAILDVKKMFGIYMEALERRSQELKNEIEKAYSFKMVRLHSHVNTLINQRQRLEGLVKMLEGTRNKSRIQYITALEKAQKEFHYFVQNQFRVEQCKIDSIRFLIADNGLHAAICGLGMVINSGRGWDQELPTRQVAVSTNTSPQCRPIYGVVSTITLKKPSSDQPKLNFCEEGGLDGQLCRPWGVCCNGLGDFIVADRSNNRIQVFDSQGNFKYNFGKAGVRQGEFNRPAGICVSPNNSIVVADKDNHRIQVFKMDGQFIFTFGQKGSQDGQFNYPWDVACNSQGDIVVSDTRNHRIQLFDNRGRYLNKYGSEGNVPMYKMFDSPRGVCFTPQGHVLVTDFNNHFIVFIHRTFKCAKSFGAAGTGENQFSRPQGIVCDDQGNIVVADSKNYRIQMIDNQLNFVHQFGRYGNAPSEFDRPSGICLTPEGNIVVLDYGNVKVKVF